MRNYVRRAPDSFGADREPAEASNPLGKGQVNYTMRKHYVVQMDRAKSKARCREWQLRVDSGTRTKSGNTSWLTRKVSGLTYTQAMRECEAWAADLDEGRAVRPTSWTFRSYREHYRDTQLALGYPDAETVKKKARFLKSAGRHLDGIQIQDITPADVESCLAKLRAGDSPSGKCLSGTTLNCISKAMNTMFAHAEECGIIAANPCRKAERPQCDTKEKAALTLAQVSEFVSKMDPADRFQRGVILMAETGARQCAVRLCKWSDWDETAGTLRIPATKREERSRTVPVSRTLAAALSVARFHVQLCLGTEDIGDVWLLCNDAGDQMPQHALGGWWWRNRGKYGMPKFTLHQLRHSMATNLARMGVNIRVTQEILGDKSLDVVARIYTHVDEEQKAAAIRALDIEPCTESVQK